MRPFAVAFALLAAVALAALVSLQLLRDDARPRRAAALTLLGDSLNVGIEPYVDGELDGWTITRHDVAGRSGADGLAALRALGDAVAPVVVISLGTNDPQADVAGFRRLVEAVVRQAGPGRCVVWSTIWLGGPNGPFNDVLRAAAGRHPSLEIADWAGMVDASPELLAPDGVHGSPEGYARRAEQVARLAERCLPAPEPRPGR